MTKEELDRTIGAELGRIAPDADAAALASLDRSADLRDALDLDSMDFLNLMIALHDRLSVDIPEADYPQVRSWATLAEYLARRLGVS
jgi:acyl carrier protein